jgi:hypothetical protein
MFPGFFGPQIYVYEGLFVWTGRQWVCDHDPRSRTWNFKAESCEPGWALPELLSTYNPEERYLVMRNIAPPFYYAALWFLGTDNLWHLHRMQKNNQLSSW